MTRDLNHARSAALLAMLLPFASAVAADNWSGFQNGGRLAFEAPADAGAPKIEWTADIPGGGQSSPVVWDGHIYVTSVSGPNKETYHVTAFNLEDGVRLWSHDMANASPQESTGYVSLAAPSPVADDAGIICFFEGGNLIALTHAGEVRWERNLVREHGPIDARHGLGSSVEQSDHAAFVWVERQTQPYLLAVDKRSGDTLWKKAGLGVTSWASPRLLPVAGGVHLVLSGIGKIVAFDPATGERLWEFDQIAGNSTPTPMPVGEGRFLIGATVGREGGDSAGAARSNGLIAVTKDEAGRWKAEFVWQADGATSSFGSPIAAGDCAYFVNRTGVLYCLDMADGSEVYAQRLDGSIWATPVAVGGRVVFFLKDGLVKGIAGGRNFVEQFELPLPGVAEPPPAAAEESPISSGPTLYAGVVAGERILARFGDRLVSLRGSASQR
jgi:outer membrane protein assembly factor BamB